MKETPRFHLCALSLLVLGCGEDFDLPPVVASSKYIAFRTDADASVVCLDDLLSREDDFIERTAALLGVEPPVNTIDYVYDPVRDDDDPWVCPTEPGRYISACFRSRSGDDLSLVVAGTPSQHHELVHAIDVQALGQGSHPTLFEGLADYLGSLDPTLPYDDFPQRFTEMLAESPRPRDYNLAMYFVGHIFEQHGAAAYRELRESMPRDAAPTRFAEVFADVYGHSLADALDDMRGMPIHGIDRLSGCSGAPELPWSEERQIDAVITATCGDPWFYGGGFDVGTAGFYGYYIVDLPWTGTYELTVEGVGDGPTPLRGLLTACSFENDDAGVASIAGNQGVQDLQSGRHTLGIAFPQNSRAEGEAMVHLRYRGPTP